MTGYTRLASTSVVTGGGVHCTSLSSLGDLRELYFDSFIGPGDDWWSVSMVDEGWELQPHSCHSLISQSGFYSRPVG